MGGAVRQGRREDEAVLASRTLQTNTRPLCGNPLQQDSRANDDGIKIAKKATWGNNPYQSRSGALIIHPGAIIARTRVVRTQTAFGSSPTPSPAHARTHRGSRRRQVTFGSWAGMPA